MTTNNDNRYGHLLDRYMNDTHVDYKTKQERKEESRSRYGHLLDYAKPDYSILENMVKIEESGRERRRKEDEEEKRANQRRQERIEREKMERQKRIDKNSAFVDSFLAKKEAERKAVEEKRKEAEREQNFLNNIQRMIDIKDETAAMIARTNKMLQADEEKRKEHEEKMAWYRKQRGAEKVGSR
mgnify:CR=1 FL=1